jgi:hypothetical protein
MSLRRTGRRLVGAMATDDIDDTHALLAAERRRLRSHLPPSLERQLREALNELEPLLGARALRDRLRRLAGSAYVESDVSHASRKPGLALVKRAVKLATSWYVHAIVAQVNQFAFESVATLEAVALKLSELERRLEAVEPLRPALARTISLPWPEGTPRAVVDVLRELEPGSRVILADATADATAMELARAGLDVLGASLDPASADELAANGIEVRLVGLAELLRTLAPGSVDAVVLRGAELEFADAPAKRALLRAAREASRTLVAVAFFEPAHLLASEELAAEAALRPGPLPTGAWLALLEEERARVRLAPLAGGAHIAVARWPQ